MRVRFRLVHSIVLAVLAAGLWSCATRTAAATQPTPAAFDPAASDAKAIEVVDQMLAAVGGAEIWSDTKQLQWEQKYYRDTKLSGWFRHAWDRWNGRHRFEIADMASYEAYQSSGNESDFKWTVSMYDLFDKSGTATYGGKEVIRSDREAMITKAYGHWQSDSYRISGHYKLKDPGVILKHEGQVTSLGGKCEPSCDVIKVTFDPAVGSDTYYFNINSDSHMPEVVEKVIPTGRLGFSQMGWTQAGGMQFPTEFQNLGLQGEKFAVENIQVGAPDDALYIPEVR